MMKPLRFTSEQMSKIEQRFNQFAIDQKLSLSQFKKSMGLLGIGEGQPISERIFRLITPKEQATFEQFLHFLDGITNGSSQQKSQMSFNFLDRTKRGYITYEDIQIIISEISFLWYFLTGQQISNSAAIQFICGKLGIDQNVQIGVDDYFLSYDQQFNWFQYFNHKLNPSTKQFLNHNVGLAKRKQSTTSDNMSITTKQQQFPIDQVEQYLHLLKSEMENMILRLKSILICQQQQGQTTSQNSKDIDEDSRSIIWQLSTVKGPQPHTTVPQTQLKGDKDKKDKRTPQKILYQHQLEKQLTSEGDNQVQIITNRLRQLSQLPEKIFKFPLNHSNGNSPDTRQGGLRRLSKNRFSYVFSDQDKKASINKTHPSRGKRQNIVYFGHPNWNLMLNVMLGIRKSLKQHYFIYTTKDFQFTQEDLACKYINQLIYKKNNKSVKQVSETFIDYCPKVFFYVRKWFSIDNQQYLKSIGLENLVGNLLLGNLSTLTEQTSEGKSGSFMYYTEDSKLIVKSISREEYKKFRQILRDYLNYIKTHPQTFLIKIYGLYKLKNKSDNRQIYFIVFNNIFDKGVEIDQRYDIKGSTYNRQTLSEEYPYEMGFSKNMALKDMDLINSGRETFKMGNQQKLKIYNQIVADAEFLSSHNIIEYSLLIGISSSKDKPSARLSYDEVTSFQSNSETPFWHHEIWSQDRSQNYFFGLIDILSEYTVKKVFQNHFFHSIGKDISCLAPDQYFRRFKDFIYKYIFAA